ncbi:MAG: hypothetical protein M3P08_04365 [Thermoproteota archaeon]|jgi:hypothetical protein|nr:hypothetical protein [Thermoproteota archaeon]
MTTYDERDVAIMANVVFHGLCELDEEGRRNSEEPRWQNIGPLADKVGAVASKVHVAYIAEHALILMGFIERNQQNTKVRLTGPGRENCARGIDIPRSDIQKLSDRLGE